MKAWIAAWFACCMAVGVALAQPSEAPAGGDATTRQQVLVLLHLPAAHFRADGNYSGVYANGMGSAARRHLAQSLARLHGLGLASSWPMPMLGLDCYVMDVPPTQHPDSVVAQLERDPRVAWAQPMHLFRPLAHNDPLFGAQPAAREWQLDELHAVATGRNVRVAIIDSGVQFDHPDLKGQIALDLNLVAERAPMPEIHGTAVAGIIAARADNHLGVAGVAPEARLLTLRACWQAPPGDTRCDSLSLARALHAAIEQEAQIVNLSLGGPPDRLIRQLVELAMARGIGVVAAVDRAASEGGFPAAIQGVVAVSDAAPGQASKGWLAPGTDILTTLPGSRWGAVSGASYAAAHVSGLLALMHDAQSRSGRARKEVATGLVRRTDGRIDACASVSRAGAACACSCNGVSPMASMAPR